MDAHPGPLTAPRLSPPLRVGEIDEGLAGEEALAHERHHPLHPGLVLRGAHPGRVDHEPAGLRVLDERLVQARLERVGPLDDRLHVVGDHRGEHAAEEHPRRFAAVDHIADRLTERQPHEAVARHDRREDQRMTHPAAAGRPVGHQPEPAEVDLALVARLAVVHPHRRAPPAPPDVAHLQRVTVQRALRHHDPASAEELMGLAHRELVLLQPALDELMVGDQQPPRVTPAIRAVRAHNLHHRADEPVGELLLTAVADQTPLNRGGHVAADRLAVQPRQPLRRPDPLAPQPQPQHFTNLVHTNLPERHRRPPGPLVGRRQLHRQRHRRWWTPGGPITGDEVVPCSWRNSPQGGPMLLASDTLAIFLLGVAVVAGEV